MKKIKISAEKIQKKTNWVDWIFSQWACGVIAIGAAIAQAISHMTTLLAKSTFSQMFFDKMERFRTLNLTSVRNVGIGFTTMEIWSITNNFSRNCGPSNLLFRSTDFCLGHRMISRSTYDN